MEYTYEDRARHLLELVCADPECAACLAEMEQLRETMAAYTDPLPQEERQALWTFPTAVHTYFSRVIDVALREMRFPLE